MNTQEAVNALIIGHRIDEVIGNLVERSKLAKYAGVGAGVGGVAGALAGYRKAKKSGTSKLKGAIKGALGGAAVGGAAGAAASAARASMRSGKAQRIRSDRTFLNLDLQSQKRLNAWSGGKPSIIGQVKAAADMAGERAKKERKRLYDIYGKRKKPK